MLLLCQNWNKKTNSSKRNEIRWMMQLLHFTTLLLEQLQHKKIFCPDYRLVLQFSLIESILMAIKFGCYILLIGLQFTLLTVSLGWRYDVCLGKISQELTQCLQATVYKRMMIILYTWSTMEILNFPRHPSILKLRQLCHYCCKIFCAESRYT